MPTLDFLNDLYLTQSLSAYHWDRELVERENLNERNYGIGLEHDSGDWKQMIGNYKNSFGRNTNYGLVGYMPLQYDTPIGKLKLGAALGGLTGYDMPVAPAAGLLAALEGERAGLNLTFVPNASMNGKKAYGFLGLQAKMKLGKE